MNYNSIGIIGRSQLDLYINLLILKGGGRWKRTKRKKEKKRNEISYKVIKVCGVFEVMFLN